MSAASAASTTQSRKRRLPASEPTLDDIPNHTASSSASSSSYHYYGDGYQTLLESELAIFQALLRRHRPAHGRTRYFQRVRMAFAAVNKSVVLTVYPRLTQWARKRQIMQRRNNDVWSVAEDEAQIVERNALLRWANSTAVEVLSRLESCVDVLVGELSRGFFVPWNITAFALVARVWTLVGALRSQIHSTTGTPSESRTASVTADWTRKQQQQQQPRAQKKSVLDAHAQQILTSLGIHIPDISKPLKMDRELNIDPSDGGDKTSKNQHESAPDNDDAHTPKSSSLDLLQSGEPEDVGETANSMLSYKNNKNSDEAPLVDNATSLLNWQQSQKKNKKKRKGTEDVEKKKRKKEKKKQKSGNFFDKLFG